MRSNRSEHSHSLCLPVTADRSLARFPFTNAATCRCAASSAATYVLALGDDTSKLRRACMRTHEMDCSNPEIYCNDFAQTNKQTNKRSSLRCTAPC